MPAFVEMQAGNAERFFGQVNAGDLGAESGHPLAEQSAAAADVDRMFSPQAHMTVDPCQSSRIYVMQRAEFGVWVPPAMGKFPKFVHFAGIDIAACIHIRHSRSSLDIFLGKTPGTYLGYRPA